MKLTSITEGTALIINAYTEDNSIEFNTKCIQILDNAILVEPIKKEKEPINFKSDIVNIDISMIREDQSPIIWKNVAISYIGYMNQEFHYITAFSEGFPFNRRNAYREYMGMIGSVQIGLNKMAYEIIVKDISSIGFAFVTSEDLDIIGELSHLVFQDKDQVPFNIYGQVVRKQIIHDKKFVYGCVTASHYSSIETYIIKKQRERAQNKPNQISL